MTTIVNYTSRIFNLKIAVNSTQRIKIKLNPGINRVDDAKWEAFASKDGKKVDPFVQRLLDNGDVEYGDNIRQKGRLASMPKSEPKVDVTVMKAKGSSKGDKK